MVQKAGEHGWTLFIDPHQDVWSRFSGGDGAPGWTLEAAGLDMTHFDSTGAAITHQRARRPIPQDDLADQLHQAGVRHDVHAVLRRE